MNNFSFAIHGGFTLVRYSRSVLPAIKTLIDSCPLPPARSAAHLRMHRLRLLALALPGTAAGAAPKRLVIDPAQSHIAIAVRSTVGSFVGELASYTTAITVDPEQPAAASAVLDFHFADVKTGLARRDQDMLAWEQAATFPEGRFVLTALDASGAAQFRARGRLTLHGQSREITIPVTITQEPDRWVIAGEARLDTRDFGLPIIRSYLLLTVEPIVRVTFHLEGRLGAR